VGEKIRVALVTARAARGLDEDEAPLKQAFEAAGCEALPVEWDDPQPDWGSFRLVLLRSAWDYAERIQEFLAWVERVSAVTNVLNPLPLVRWNTDKHYIAKLARAGISTVPSTFVEPGEDAGAALKQVLQRHANAELVVKPAVGAGSRDAQRHKRQEFDSAVMHMQRLLSAGRSALVQPYLERVDVDGETALMFFEGRFSHAVRKGPLLPPGGAATSGLFAAETIDPRQPGADELRLAQRIIGEIPFGTPLYARIDLIRGDRGEPCLLELELTEPSLFFNHAPGSADRYAAAVLRWYGQRASR